MRLLKTAWLAAGAATVSLLALAGPAPAQVQPYQANDFGGFRNILPPGEGKNANAAEALAAQSGTLPAHYDDQRLMYQDLVFATPGLQMSGIGQYYKDGSFGVQPADVERTYQPDPANHPGLTVVRDAGFGVPHIYGTTRSDVMFGTGYVGAEDRLFFMDVLRHTGRAELSSFVGGSNRAMDAEVWDVAPYTEPDLQKQIDLADEVYGAEGVALQQDLADYLAGINKYVDEAQADPVTKMPAEYAALGQTLEDWKGTDVIATASLIGGIFGKGGGGEVGNAEVNSAAKARFGPGPGETVWTDFRQANDPEAPTTVHGQNFPYQERTGVDPDAVAIPKPGTLVDGSPDDAPGPSDPIGGLLGGIMNLPGGSNALLVSGQESNSGHPLAVFGPQAAYFAPQILMEEDLHGPDIDARGATFPGINLYVQLGRGQDFAWSATSAGQDIIDTFAEKLCEPDGPDAGSEPDPGTINSMHYLYNGECRPIEVLNRDQVVLPRAGDTNGLGPYHLEAQRTVHGVISKRGMVTVNGQDVPVAFAKLRSTYFHEADSARAFSDMNRPSRVQNAQDFQQVMSRNNLTFNWFYADDKDIAYFNSGDNPVRAPGTDPEFPTWGTGEWDWQGWDPVLDPNAPGLSGGTNIADYTAVAQHPQVVNQDYLTSWNNKQAPGYRAAEGQYGYSSHYRSDSLDERILPKIAGGSTMSLQELIDAMEDAGTVDLRGSQVLPWMLEVIESGPGGVPADLTDELVTLNAWVASGAHRRDRDQSGSYDESAAVRLMDAWWDPPGDPLTTPSDPEGVLEAAFRPSLGDDLFQKIRSQLAYDNPPNNHGAHLGSAYQDGWWGQFEKDLRAILGESVQGGHSRRYCGGDQNTQGTLASCHDALVDSLRETAAIPATTLYQDGGCTNGDQMCFDEVRFRTVGVVGVDPIHWINRPTWQQVVEVQGHRARSSQSNPTGGGGASPGAGHCASAIVGSRRRDVLAGTALSERIVGRRRADRITGGDGDDCILGQRGKDRLAGEGGADEVRGGNGRDRIDGGPGADTLRGGSGNDRIYAADGEADRISCGKGTDKVSADPSDQLSSSCE